MTSYFEHDDSDFWGYDSPKQDQRYATQGGGICDGNMRWVEVPKGMEHTFTVGMLIPNEWSVTRITK